MGEVYKAHDTRLRRDVAIKTSAQRFSARFELEARAIAALNHPNICQIYDVGPDYIVMELVEGPTLGERIKEGAVPLEEAESIALQVALALEAAHEKKITHRDLKPGNIKVKPDGVVKVLDFGLAKVGQALRPDTLGEDSPTLTMALTEAGMILGTAAYMAPEQAKGKPVDHRADIWAFGVVLHEMLTGKRLFTGEDLADVLASVVKDQPDLTVVPKRVRKLLHACLQKDPSKRLQSIGDAKLLLADEESTPAPVVAKPRPTWPAWAAAGTMTALAAGAIAMWAPWRAAPEEKLLHVTITPPQASELSTGAWSGISPDGRKLFVVLRQDNTSKLWVRSLDTNTFQPLPGTEAARSPFWSPDSRFIGFFNDGKLKVVPAAGGPAQELCGETGLGF
jgi:serine/threonine protein kinase